MRYLPNGTWMGKADAYTIEQLGIPSIVLMEHAALKTVEAMEQEAIDLGKVLIVCGSGNNGGDGFAVARLLKQKGCSVTVLFTGKESSMSPECKIQAHAVRCLGIPIVTELPDESFPLVVDAIFGVGLNREIQGHYKELIQQLNELPGQKVAVDIPSGIHAGTGQVLGVAFQADLTVSFQCEKLGTVLFPGKSFAGKVLPADIGIQENIFAKEREVCYTLDLADVPSLLPRRKANSHKGSYGKVLMITGSEGMAGAAYLSAKAAYTCGAGLVQIYTPTSNRVVLQQLLPEAIVTTYEDFDQKHLRELLEWADVICIGCGFGQSEVSHQILKCVLTHRQVPCVVDADGINLLSCSMEYVIPNSDPLILTPHLKEMSRLTGCSVAEIQEKRFQILDEFCNHYDAVCVLKDARTVVAREGKQYFVNTAGNQSMAKAGSGDVLAGVITGMLAGHLEPYDAAVAGVYLHACGGDHAKETLGSYSVLAEDLIAHIGAVIKEAEDTI